MFGAAVMQKEEKKEEKTLRPKVGLGWVVTPKNLSRCETTF